MTMEMLLVAQHRNQYYGRSRANGPARLGSFESPPSKDFRDINCRTFQSGAGILPAPFKACTTPVTKRACSSPTTTTPSPSPSPSVNCFRSDESKHFKKTSKHRTFPIPICIKADTRKESFNGEFPYSERWAGPAYSNSPPPSSLPIPKFSIRSKRTVSLELPASSASGFDFHPTAKSAPPSPTRDHSNFSSKDLFHNADSATKTLRRILNLDIADE